MYRAHFWWSNIKPIHPDTFRYVPIRPDTSIFCHKCIQLKELKIVLFHPENLIILAKCENTKT